uniref:Uncharacterized protein n=1 Tax=Tetranychus urticae TaxID=32264 RepID=T1KWH1_TETUR
MDLQRQTIKTLLNSKNLCKDILKQKLFHLFDFLEVENVFLFSLP